MRTGTKSLLVGAHWPPHMLAVTLAWRWMYGSWPTWRELVVIGLHDVGYLGCTEMDGVDGTRHPELGARIADVLLGSEYGDLIRGHSQGYADLAGVPLSRLYGPDKLSHMMEPSWLYVARTRLTGELAQYRARTRGGRERVDDASVGDRAWFRIVRMRMARGGMRHVINHIAPAGIGRDRGR